MTGGTWHVNAPILSWTTVITGTTLDISHQNVPPSDGCAGGCGAEDIPDPGDDSQPYAPQGTQHPIPRSNLGPIGAPSPHAECAGNFSVTLMDGSIHSFALLGAFVDCYSVYGGQVARDFGADIKRAAAVDGSQIGIDLTNLSDVVVSLPNGNTLHFDLSGPSGLSAWNGSPALAKAIVDSNGNVISLVGTGASISSITDTLGRTITFGPIISAIATGFLPSYISYSDQNSSGGIVTRTITINPRSDVHLAPQFAQPAQGVGVTPNTAYAGNFTHAGSLVLADGISRYSFEYNEYGELSKIKYPLGG